MTRAEKIRQFLIAKIPKHSAGIVALAEEKFSVSRTTIHRHLNHLVRQGIIEKSGNTSQITYHVKSSRNRSINLPIDVKLDEFEVYNKYIATEINALPLNVIDIVMYGVTEIVNNAKDHSSGTQLSLLIQWEQYSVTVSVIDDGVGIFKKLKDDFILDDLREGVLQLSKGKMTSDPENHSGEGVFFSSRAFDRFDIFSNQLHYCRDNIENDWFLEKAHVMKGTRVDMTIGVDSKANLTNIFQQFQSDDDLAFDKTKILVELSKFGEERFISRSQAKRITRNLEKFKIVTLDFKNVRTVGQGFVDEIFRIFHNKYPTIIIDYINTSEDVEFMIKRGMATAFPSS